MRLKVKERVAISCVTFETAKIVKPIRYLGNVDRVYLLHYERPDPEKTRNVYNEFYDEVVRQLEDGPVCGEIVGSNVRVYRFKEVLAKVLEIMRAELGEGNEVYINVSAGTSEFVAAATIASMMMRGVVPYTVGTSDWTVPEEDLTIYYEGDRPVGMSKDVNDPQVLPTFHIERPPDELVEALKILKEKIDKGHRTTYLKMIEALKADGCWEREAPENVKDPVQSDKMYYSRHYIDEWVKRGWVDRDQRGRLSLTEDGMTVIEVF